MGKIKIGQINQTNIVKGDENLLERNELLVIDDYYTILKKKSSNGITKTFIVIPLKEFKDETSSRKKMEKKTKYASISTTKNK